MLRLGKRTVVGMKFKSCCPDLMISWTASLSLRHSAASKSNASNMENFEMRSSLFVCLSVLALAVILYGAKSSVSYGDTTTKEPDKLSEKDESALRAVVAKHFIATAYWQPKGSKPDDFSSRYRVLCLPQEIGEIYGRKPLETLRSLKKIIEVGAVADAHTAAAYAHAAVGYANEDPVQLIAACSYAYYPTAKEFDDVNPVIPKTYRQFAIEHVDRLIMDTEKQLTENATKPKKK